MAQDKRMPSSSISLLFAGDLVLAKNNLGSHDGLFLRYQTLFEYLANCDKKDRILQYKMLTALMLTSLARRETIDDDRKILFDLKNQIFFSLAKDSSLQKKLQYHYLSTKTPSILSYCPGCTEKQKALPKKKWRHCRQCHVDRTFYNVVAMEYAFDRGSFRIFLGQQYLEKLGSIRFTSKTVMGSKGKKEEALLEQYHYNTKNLHAVEKKSILAMQKRLLQGDQL